MDDKVTKGQRLKRRLSQLTIKPLSNVLRSFSPAAGKIVVALSPSDVEGDSPGPSPLPLKQLETVLDAVFLERLAPAIQTQSQPKVTLPTVARIGGV